MSTSENKRIAKNTLLLYIRMAFLMAITLYTSRIILQVLGVTDYGIYNVVGGVVTMLGFLGSSLSGATSRFITFELGTGNFDNVKRVFRCAITIHYILAIVIFILAETICFWFVMNKMVIPNDRMIAAIWVYQCSIVTFIVSILSVPYNALIIAHEQMKAFAYISIFEAVTKLIVVFMLKYTNLDRLILYAILILIVQIFIRLLYTIYCNRHFSESSARWLWDKNISRKMAIYAGWTMNGDLAVIGYTQGINILLNLFFGPTVNAARGIAVQVQSAVNQFFGNFQMAVRPQITKLYAQGELQHMHNLIINSCKYSYYLILIVAVPILANTEFILNLWLDNVPEHAVAFTQIMIIVCINGAFSQPTIMAIHATGNIKVFQIVEGSLLLLVLPISYIFLKYKNISSETVLIIYLIIEFITQFVRVYIVYPKIKLPIKKYFTDILYPAIKVSTPIILAFFSLFTYLSANNLTTFIVYLTIDILFISIIIYLIGLNKQEKNYIFKFVKQKIHKI